MARPSRRSLIGIGIGAAGVAAAGVAGRVLARRTLPALDQRTAVGLPAGVLERRLLMDDGATLRVLDAGPDRAGAGPDRAGPDRAGPDRAGPDRAGPDRAGPDRARATAKPPVVLLHGITLGADIWHRQLADLAAAGHRVVAYDMRGHGGSGAEQLTFERLAQDMAEVLSQLDLWHVVLIGHSMGGMVAIKALAGDRVTATGRGRVAALGLVGTSANPVTGSGVPGARIVARTLQPMLARTAWLTSRIPGPTLPKDELAYLLARVNFGDDPEPAEVALTQQLVSGVRAHVTGELLVEILRFDDLAALGAVDLPAAVVVGTRDIVTPVRYARALAEAIGGAELTILEGCGHMVMNERPDELHAAITRLAGRVAADTPRRASAATGA